MQYTKVTKSSKSLKSTTLTTKEVFQECILPTLGKYLLIVNFRDSLTASLDVVLNAFLINLK